MAVRRPRSRRRPDSETHVVPGLAGEYCLDPCPPLPYPRYPHSCDRCHAYLTGRDDYAAYVLPRVSNTLHELLTWDGRPHEATEFVCLRCADLLDRKFESGSDIYMPYAGSDRMSYRECLPRRRPVSELPAATLGGDIAP